MLKTIAKLALVFICTVIVAIIAAGAAYIITKNSVKSETGQTLSQTVNTKTSESTVAAKSEKSDALASFDYYIVRLEGKNLGVYANHDGKEEFLYNEDIYTNDLTNEDITLLSTGVMLETSEALTGFIENFTS